MATAAQLVTDASTILQDTGHTRWATSEVLAALNTIQREFCARSGMLRDVATLAVDATQDPATAFYTIPTNSLEASRFTLDGRTLERLSPECLGDQWETVTGEPYGYIYGDFGPALVRLYPYPAAAATTLKLWHLRTPVTMTTSPDVGPEVPDTWAQALVYGAVALLYLKDFEGGDPSKAAIYRQMYETQLADYTRRAVRSLDRSPRTVPTSWW